MQEKQYANELFKKYYKLIGSKLYASKCAINDVENTIDALRKINTESLFIDDFIHNEIIYYKNVLQILKSNGR